MVLDCFDIRSDPKVAERTNYLYTGVHLSEKEMRVTGAVAGSETGYGVTITELFCEQALHICPGMATDCDVEPEV